MRRRLKDSLHIVCLSVGAAITYGVIHDQVTVRLSLEYFTIGHQQIFPTTDPTLLALGWGIVATWWAGLLLAVPLAVIAQGGFRPRASAHQLVKPVIVTMLGMGMAAVLAGSLGFVLAQSGAIHLEGT